MKSFRHSWFVAALAIGSGTLIYAQPSPGASGAGDTKPAQAISGTTTAKLTVAEMTTRHKELRAQVKDDNRHTLHLRELARKQKDVIKLNCVNDKYIQMKAQTNIFDTASAELDGALESPADSRYALYTEVTVGADSIHKLREEADVCVGEVDVPTGEFPPEVTGPGIDQPSGNPFDEGVEPPGYASPYN